MKNNHISLECVNPMGIWFAVLVAQTEVIYVVKE